MNILFVHQNMPGQFKHLAPALAARPGADVVALGKRKGVRMPGIRYFSYAEPKGASPETHHYVRSFENAVRHGQQVARAGLALKRRGFTPDIVIAHPGWGEALFVKDVWPQVPLLTFAEFYYRGEGADIGFDPADPASFDDICRARARNAHLLLSLEAADAAIAPTLWQRAQHPAALRDKIHVIFDGIDTDRIRPDSGAIFALPDGTCLETGDEVVTYVARNLEPYRGFPTMMRALPAILEQRPNARIVIVGGDEVSYGRKLAEGNWRERMLAEVPLGAFGSRVHFVGKLPYAHYLALLQVSSVHVYLTYPFVLSWSCMEALAAGCLVTGSDTPPVREVIAHGENGLLVPFFEPGRLADEAVAVLANPDGYASLRRNARAAVVAQYGLETSLRRQIALIDRLVEAGSVVGAAGIEPATPPV